MASYLARHFDPALEVPPAGSRAELEAAQIDRLRRSLSVIIICGSIPRRLGGDATPEELALDKKRARRVAHALNQSLKGWTKKKTELPADDQIRQEGAQIIWETWGEAHLADLGTHLRILATWAVTHGEEAWGKSAVVKLENEINWLSYALRE